MKRATLMLAVLLAAACTERTGTAPEVCPQLYAAPDTTADPRVPPRDEGDPIGRWCP